MSSAVLPMSVNESSSRLVELTIQACEYARTAAGRAADALAGGNPEHFGQIHSCERHLDEIDREMDEAVVFAISESTVSEARQLLSCVKFVIDLERIGDLIASFAGGAQSSVVRLDAEDRQDLVQMATVLEKMISDAQNAFVEKDVNRALAVFRADSEMDRLRNIIFLHHIEAREAIPNFEGNIQVLFMAQALERAGDHAKNLGEEVCHYVTGRTIRHLLLSNDKSDEQMFLDWLREKKTTR